MIVPERIGNISPTQIAEEVLFILNNKSLLAEQKINLLKTRGKNGAVQKLSNLILNILTRY